VRRQGEEESIDWVERPGQQKRPCRLGRRKNRRSGGPATVGKEGTRMEARYACTDGKGKKKRKPFGPNHGKSQAYPTSILGGRRKKKRRRMKERFPPRSSKVGSKKGRSAKGRDGCPECVWKKEKAHEGTASLSLPEREGKPRTPLSQKKKGNSPGEEKTGRRPGN